MSKISLAFTPGFQFDEKRNVGTNVAASLFEIPASITVPKTMLHRRIYLWHNISTGAFTIDARLVFRCAGQILGFIPYRIGLPNAMNQNFAIGATTNASPNTIDMIRVTLNAVAQSIAPFNFVIAADTITLEGSSTKATAAAICTSYLACVSQHYW